MYSDEDGELAVRFARAAVEAVVKNEKLPALELPAHFDDDSGAFVTLNTDDPGISAIDLPYEYEVAAPAAGLTPEQIRRAQRNALDIAFLTTEEKDALLARKSTSKAP